MVHKWHYHPLYSYAEQYANARVASVDFNSPEQSQFTFNTDDIDTGESERVSISSNSPGTMLILIALFLVDL